MIDWIYYNDDDENDDVDDDETIELLRKIDKKLDLILKKLGNKS